MALNESFSRRLDGDAETEHHGFTKSKLSNLEQSGQSVWGKLNRPVHEVRDDAISDLEELDRSGDFNEAKHIDDLKKAESPQEITAKLDRMDRAASKWYIEQMQASPAFKASVPEEAKVLKQEFESLVDGFKDMPFTGGRMNKIKVIQGLKDMLKAKEEFREDLDKRSDLVKEEYARRLPMLGLYGNRPALLKEIDKEMKGYEKEPSAVQDAIEKDIQKESSGVKTDKIIKRAKERFAKKCKDYKTILDKYRKHFGGDTAKQFEDWFETQESFDKMDEGIGKLPTLGQQRKKVDEQGRKLINKIDSEEDRNDISAEWDEMGRSERENYLKTLEQSVQEKSVHKAKFEARMLTAKVNGIPLFSEFEQARELQMIQHADLETQEAMLKVQRAELTRRKHVAERYMALPEFVRDEELFTTSHALDREAMLAEAEDKLSKRSQSPFDTEHIDDAFDYMDSIEGEKEMDNVIEELVNEGEVNEELNAVYKRLYGFGKRMERYNETQDESTARDLRHWVRLDQSVKEESDARNDRERSKLNFMTANEEAMEHGYVLSSGGIVHKLQEINERELRAGNSEEIGKKLGKAKYAEHIRLSRENGEMARDPLEILERLSEDNLQKLVFLGMKKLSESRTVQNSAKLKTNLRQKMIDREFASVGEALKKAA